MQVFELSNRGDSKGGKVAGCRIAEGGLRMGETFRVLRGGTVIHEGKATSLRRGKQEVQRVGKDTECGVLLEDFSDAQPGDVIHCISVEMVVPSREEVLQPSDNTP